jgi:hypothetical protein
MARHEQWQQGRRNGIKACVEWLHAEAETMNDPKARAILNTAALSMGTSFKRAPSSKGEPL